MSFKKAFLMLLVVIAGAFYLIENPETKSDESEQALFPSLSVDEIAKISSSDYSLIKIDKTWKLEGLEKAVVDASAAQNLINAFDSMVSRNSFSISEFEAGEEGLGLLGDDEISFELSGKKTTLVLGKEHSFSGRRYLKIKGEDVVHLVDESSITPFRVKAFDLRDKLPFKLQSGKIRKIDISRPAGDLVFEQGQKRWNYKYNGMEVDADINELGRMLQAVQGARVESFEGEFPAAGIIKVSINGDDMSELSFRIAKTDKGLVAQVLPEGEVFTLVDGRLYPSLTKDGINYRSKKVFSKIKPETLRAVNIRSLDRPDDEYSLVRIENDEYGKVWAISSGEKQRDIADKEVTLSWLDSLVGMSVLTYGVSKGKTLEDAKVIELFYSDDGQNFLSEQLIVQGRVESSDSSESGSEVPVYGVIQDGTATDIRPVVIGNVVWDGLNKDKSYFLKPEPQNIDS